MTKEQFIMLTRLAVDKAIALYAHGSDASLPDRCVFSVNDQLDLEYESLHDVIDKLYVGETFFHKYIHVFVKHVDKGKCLIVFGVSNFEPVEYEHTWDPEGLGPYKPIVLIKK